MGMFVRNSRMMNSFRGEGDRPPFEGFYIYGLLILLSYVLSDLVLLNIRPLMLPKSDQAPPAYNPNNRPLKISMRQDLNPISDRNLFNSDGVIPPALSAAGEEKAPEDAPAVLSQLPLKLEGTIVHLNPNRSVATVALQTKNETKAFMTEDEIEGMAKIVKIERRRITFRNLNSNRLEYIEIPKEGGISFGFKTQETAASGSEEVARHSDFDFSIKREDINKYTSDLSSILQQARMVPNILPGSGGKVDGFRFVSIQPNSIYEKLGFKMGDVIKEVNGEPVNSPTKAMELYNALRSENRIKLSVERDGKNESFSYDVKD